MALPKRDPLHTCAVGGAHHYLLPPPNGSEWIDGRCTKCGAVKRHPAALLEDRLSFKEQQAAKRTKRQEAVMWKAGKRGES